MNVRLLACDIDNTLVQFPDPPSARTHAAVRAAVDAGVIVCLVTGRAFRRALPVAAALGIETPIICNHGGSIRAPANGAIVHRETLPRPLTEQVVSWLQGQQVHILVFDRDTVYHDARPGSVIPDFRVYTEGEGSVYAADVRDILPDRAEIILSTTLDRQRLAALYPRAQAAFGERTRVLYSHPHGLDIMPPSSKSQALAWLSADLGVAQADVMAVGDGANDADMLAWAGLGVAMGDGDPEALEAADAVAPSFACDGLAWAVDRYILDSTAPRDD